MVFPMGPLFVEFRVKTLSRSSRDFLHPNYRKLDSVGEWDTWRREKANHIQCHSTAEYGFVPPKFRWWHFESLEQFPEEALPKPPYAIYGPLVAICAKKKGTTKMDSLEFYMELSGACKDWVASLRHFSIWMGRLGIIPKGMLDALHPYLSPNLREDQHHIAHIPRIVVDNQVL
ncbi:hypothetical protein CK203_100315 [Vitis vinifera]|uniref:Uncharacterized protein n=1 Tax=Vitis vinifera TaxID=29760 RepID=A0A438D377_VITVI|nr:hypothetical protein CK203_100315 [Vitis vinifera]